MEHSYEALRLILDSITEHIVVIDEAGRIQYANRSWSEFGSLNECSQQIFLTVEPWMNFSIMNGGDVRGYKNLLV